MNDAPDDPIVAIATPSGRGGIGVVRVSGAAVVTIMTAVCGRVLPPREATYVRFRDETGAVIDEGIALYFPGPASYTGEDVLELQGHGGPVVLQLMVQRCLAVGRAQFLRLAHPGEFTQRAFLNGKLDLAQAEAVADLIDAGTETAARRAQASLQGRFSDAIHSLVEAVTGLRLLVEATLDFPEEEIEFLESAGARMRLDATRDALQLVLARAAQGTILREGLNVVLAGRPNVGKSSLLNALAGREAAIVTPHAGTTRDRVEQHIEVEGVALRIIDTAGLRETLDEAEKMGIARSWQAVQEADVILFLKDFDASPAARDADAAIAAQLPENTPRITVVNKIDLEGQPPKVEEATVYISALQHVGIDLLRHELLRLSGWTSAAESVFLARARHVDALEAASHHLDLAILHAKAGDRVLDLVAEELRLTQDALGSITGKVSADDLLGEIFSRFCIGK